jgi:hypothetical protein
MKRLLDGWHIDRFGWPVFETPEGAVNFLLVLALIGLAALFVGRVSG